MPSHAQPKPKRATAHLRGIKKRPKMLGPQTEREKAFCERWLIHFDKDRAFREAGYTGQARGGHSALVLLERFADYLRPIKEAKAKIMAERLAIDAEKIIEGMAGKVFFDPGGFYERATMPLTRKVKKPGEDVEFVEEEVRWNGEPVYGERLKPYSDLTREQQSVVEITSSVGGQIYYRLPSIKEQHAYYTSLGRQIGMFTEKLILERHNHLHTHHQLDFANVPTQKITALTRQLLPLVSQEFARSLGYTAEDIAQAEREDGVLIPLKVPA